MAEDPGFLLVQAGLVRDDQLLTAREARAQGGGTIGEHLVMAGFVDDDTLTAFYATRLVIPRVPAEHLARIPASVLKRIPADMAAEFRVVPVAADGERNLTLAMSDPADKHVVDEVAFFTGSYVVRAVATQLQIAWCLAHYYGVTTPLARARLVGGGAATATATMTATATAAAAGSPSTNSSTPVVPVGTPWEVEEEEETGPARMPIKRKKPVRRRSSELAPRSGTVHAAPEPPREPERLPAVVVDDEELTGQRLYVAPDSDLDAEVDDEDTAEHGVNGEELTGERRARHDTDEPILLDRPTRRTPAMASASAGASGSGDILLLDRPDDHPRLQPTQKGPGLGHVGSVDSRAQPGHDTEGSRGMPWVENEGENDEVRRQSKSDRRGRRSRGHSTTDPDDAIRGNDMTGQGGDLPNNQGELVADMSGAGSPAGAARASSAADKVSKDDEAAEVTTDPGEVTTNPMREMRAGSAAGGARAAGSDWNNVDDGWDVDDGWGQPGDTIPPAYLGTHDERESGPNTAIPQSGDRSGFDAAAVAAVSAAAAAALAAAPAPGNSTALPARAARTTAEIEAAMDPAELADELERSSNRLLETLRALERAPGRDEVIDVLLDHMGASLRRRAFFAVKSGVLFPFRQYGAARPGIGSAELSLEQPSTFGQVAMSRIPYRGTLSPAATEFVERALGSASKGDAAVVPVTVKGRAVGLLYGDGITAHLFDEHQMVLGRAAGQALERILASKPRG